MQTYRHYRQYRYINTIASILQQGTKKREATSLLTSPLLGGGHLRRPMSPTIAVVTLRALCQEREQAGTARFVAGHKKTREPQFYQ